MFGWDSERVGVIGIELKSYYTRVYFFFPNPPHRSRFLFCRQYLFLSFKRNESTNPSQ